MAQVKTYAEKLRHPKWQKCRLQNLERAEWACEECGAKEVNLQVHHGYYASGLDPWDYPPKSLHVVCDNCHQIAEALLAEIREAVGEFRFSDLQRVIEALHTIKKKAVETVELGQAAAPKLPKLPESKVTVEDEVGFLNELICKERARQGLNPDGTDPNNPAKKIPAAIARARAGRRK